MGAREGAGGKSPSLPGIWNREAPGPGRESRSPRARSRLTAWGLSVTSGGLSPLRTPPIPPPGSRGPGWRGACEPGTPTSRAPGEASPFSQLTLTSLLQGHLAPRRGPHGEGARQRGPSSPLSRPPKPRSEPQPRPACPPGSWSGTSSQNLLGPEAGSICLSPPREPSARD